MKNHNLTITNTRVAIPGFTLVEVILVVSLISVLTLLAFPSYRAVMLRTHRTQAMSQLMQVAACQERTRAAHGAYDTSRCLPDANKRYRFSYTETQVTNYYRVEAHPLGAQLDDSCGSLLLDALGRKTVDTKSRDALHCWAGR